MLALLVKSCSPEPDGPAAHPLPLKVFRSPPRGEWESVNIYIDARTVYERNLGIGALMAFALSLTSPSMYESAPAQPAGEIPL